MSRIQTASEKVTGARTMSSRTDPTVWMWAQTCDLAGQAKRLQRQLFHPTASKNMPAAWEPSADVFEDGHPRASACTTHIRLAETGRRRDQSRGTRSFTGHRPPVPDWYLNTEV